MKPQTLTQTNFISSFLLLLALLLGSAWLAPAAYADDYFVGCGLASQRFQQFIEAIEAANTNSGPDTLILAPNCFYNFVAPLDTANLSALPEITDDLLIRGRGATLQRDPNTDRLFRLITIGGNGTEVTIEDLAIRHGFALIGGGIYAGDGTSLTLKDVILSDNFSGSGGGLYSEGEVSVTGSRFEQNVAVDNGGGLYAKGTVTLTDTEVISNAGGLYLDHADGSITRSRLVNNNGGLRNGGVYITSGTLVLTETLIISSTGIGVEVENANVLMSGGQVSGHRFDGLRFQGGYLSLSRTTIMNNGGNGAFVIGNATIRDSVVMSNTGDGLFIDGDVIVDNSRFIGNGRSGLSVGGNMTVRNSQFIGNQGHGAATEGNGVIENSYFADNHSPSNTPCGGAIIGRGANVSGSTFVRNSGSLVGGGLCVLSIEATSFVVNNLFIENESAKGAAIYALGDPELFPVGTTQDTVTLVHNTIIHNSSGGSAISAGVGRSFIYNNIIVGHNLGIQGYGGSLVETDHNLFFRINFNYFGPLIGGPNDRTADPQFVDAANENFHLRFGSPAIDKGLDMGVTVDFDGGVRPQGQGFDIGAFEFGNPPPNPGGNFSIYLPLVVK